MNIIEILENLDEHNPHKDYQKELDLIFAIEKPKDYEKLEISNERINEIISNLDGNEEYSKRLRIVSSKIADKLPRPSKSNIFI